MSKADTSCRYIGIRFHRSQWSVQTRFPIREFKIIHDVVTDLLLLFVSHLISLHEEELLATNQIFDKLSMTS